jgi:hypothetical protein
MDEDSRGADTRARETSLGLVEHSVQQLGLFRSRDDKDRAVAVVKDGDPGGVSMVKTSQSMGD